MTVTISPAGQAIVALAEKKIGLQQEAAEINSTVHSLIVQIKELSDKQAGLLEAMASIDDQIDRLARGL